MFLSCGLIVYGKIGAKFLHKIDECEKLIKEQEDSACYRLRIPRRTKFRNTRTRE